MGVVAIMANGMPLPTAPPPDYLENGRLYHGYHKGSYMYPCDEQEMDRMDIFHKFFEVVRKNVLHRKDFVPSYDPPRILDIGTGTGIWAIDMADKYPEAEVQGMDLSLIQPNTIPPNLTFRQRDFDGPWGLSVESWDLIHLRVLVGSVSSWPELYQKVFLHLRPGYGYMEHVEIDFIPRCDDGTLPPNSSLNQWARYIMDATDRAYKPLAYNHNTRQFLERQGFVDIEEEVIRIPLNPWPADPHQKDIGRWYNLGVCQGLEAFTLAPLTRVAGWKKVDVERLLTEVKREICSKKYHAYNNVHIWTARRPSLPNP